ATIDTTSSIVSVLTWFVGYPTGETSMVFSPDGRTLATTGGNDRVVRLWDAATGQPTATLDRTGTDSDPDCTSTFSPDGHFIATIDWNHRLRLWDLQI